MILFIDGFLNVLATKLGYSFIVHFLVTRNGWPKNCKIGFSASSFPTNRVKGLNAVYYLTYLTDLYFIFASFADNFVMDRFHEDFVFETVETDEDSDLIEQEFRRGSDLEDIFFQDLSPGKFQLLLSYCKNGPTLEPMS